MTQNIWFDVTFFVGLSSFACNFWNLHAELIDALSVRAFRAVVPFR